MKSQTAINDFILKVKLNQWRVELWPGYITSIRQHEHDILVCAEVSHKVMRQETLYDILRSCQSNSGQTWQEDFKREVIGSVVLTDYNNRTYRVDDVDFNSSPSSTFDQKGQQVSYIDYYQQRYQLVIRDINQPMLVSNPKARDIRDGRDQVLFLIPAFCRATGLTDKMRNDYQMMRGMAEHTQMDPERRKIRLLDFTRRLHRTPNSLQQLQRFNTDLDSQLISFDGRALPQEVMIFGGGRSVPNDNRVDWTNAMKINQMFHSVPLKRWIFMYPRKFERDSEVFLGLMREVASGMNYEMGEPRIKVIADDRTASYVNEIEAVMSMDPKLIMIVVPNNAADRYAAIKRLTCVGKAIPTQVIVSKTMMPKKGNMGGVKSIATKVMIQLNSKLGGAPWMINFPASGVMTVGFDVTHDSRNKNKSYGAFVASMDLKKAVEYFSVVSPHNDGAEMSTNIELHMVQALKSYYTLHGKLPDRIFFYRDGVGDGQIEYIHAQEVKRLDAKISEIYLKSGGGMKPKFSFIIVNKRLNTRIFLNEGNRVSNPVSGTVVDTTITLPER